MSVLSRIEIFFCVKRITYARKEIQVVVDRWHAPDHTKIEVFRSRLSAGTQCKIANLVATLGVKLGVKLKSGDPSKLDQLIF